MSDKDTALPVRTEGDLDDRLQSKIVDGTDVTRRMTVDVNGNAQTKVHGTNPAGNDEQLRLSELGALTPDGVYDAANNTKPGNVGLVASSRATTPDDSTQTQRVTAIQNGNVTALDVAMRDETGTAYSASNPLPVAIATSEGSTPLHDYDTTANVAVGAQDNHEYTSTGVTTYVKSIKASASGKLKIEVQVDSDGAGVGAAVTRYVGFNSTATPNIDFIFPEPIILIPGAILRIIRSNKDNQAQDVYSTINGNTVA